MTERIRSNPIAGYFGDQRRTSTSIGEDLLSPKKTLLVLVVVVGCFAVLWPKLFYPMLVANANSHIKPSSIDKTTGCCDVISELDVETIKIMSELCSTITDEEEDEKGPPTPKEIVSRCRKTVLETCGIDISAALQERVSLGQSLKQILDEVRSLNGSMCLKHNFGVSPWRLGVPHRVTVNLDPSSSIRQERPSHLRPGMVHPAFKERGRAIIPQPDVSPVRRSSPAPRIVEGRPGPIPGMRPAMGGPGHVVTPKQQNNGFMGVLMPIYTVGFVIFFTYTIMKLVFKKKPEVFAGAPLYPPVTRDEEFHKEVFEANRNYYAPRPNNGNSKIVVNAVSALLEEVDQEIQARKNKADATLPNEQDELQANGALPKEEQGTVTVMGMETTASCEGGRRWSRPDSPMLPHPPPVAPKECSPPPQEIYLEGSLPPQSQILVADSATEAQKDSEDDAVVLAGKMTLSVISLDSETGTEDSSNSGKKPDNSDEERRTSSSNVSEEFEKINSSELEDQIDNIVQEAEDIASVEKTRFSLDEELAEFKEKIDKTTEEKHLDVIEEIKNQLNLEDDLLEALKENDAATSSLPVTDIIKEFLENEEIALIAERQETGQKEEENVRENREDLLLRGSIGKEDELHDVKAEESRIEAGEEEEEADVKASDNKNLEMHTVLDEEIFSQKEDDFAISEIEEIAFTDKENSTLEGRIEEVLMPERIEAQTAGKKEENREEPSNSDDIEETVVHPEEQDVQEDTRLILEGSDGNRSYQQTEEIEDRDVKEKSRVLQLTEEADAKIQDRDVVDEAQASMNNEETAAKCEAQDVKEETQLLIDNGQYEEIGVKSNETEEPQEIQEQFKATEETLVLVDDTGKENNQQDQLKQAASDVLGNYEEIDAKGGVKEEPQKFEDQSYVKEETHRERTETTAVKPEDHDDQEETLDDTFDENNQREQAGSDALRNNVETDAKTEDQDAATEAQIDQEPKQNVEAQAGIESVEDSEHLDVDQGIEDLEYDDQSDEEEEEVRDTADRSRNGIEISETAAENDISDDEDIEIENDDDDDDDDEEIEEIIEYVDNTDEEGEEIIEVNDNARRHINENGRNEGY